MTEDSLDSLKAFVTTRELPFHSVPETSLSFFSIVSRADFFVHCEATSNLSDSDKTTIEQLLRNRFDPSVFARIVLVNKSSLCYQSVNKILESHELEYFTDDTSSLAFILCKSSVIAQSLIYTVNNKSISIGFPRHVFMLVKSIEDSLQSPAELMNNGGVTVKAAKIKKLRGGGETKISATTLPDISLHDDNSYVLSLKTPFRPLYYKYDMKPVYNKVKISEHSVMSAASQLDFTQSKKKQSAVKKAIAEPFGSLFLTTVPSKSPQLGTIHPLFPDFQTIFVFLASISNHNNKLLFRLSICKSFICSVTLLNGVVIDLVQALPVEVLPCLNSLRIMLSLSDFSPIELMYEDISSNLMSIYPKLNSNRAHIDPNQVSCKQSNLETFSRLRLKPINFDCLDIDDYCQVNDCPFCSNILTDSISSMLDKFSKYDVSPIDDEASADVLAPLQGSDAFGIFEAFEAMKLVE
ncbi:hypothetical protein GEMRC1_004479 [Eukaryota sp. GEM-RC1]